jgi:hypothetical protein
MPRYRRSFFCKACNSPGSIDELCTGVRVIECTECGVAEVWGDSVLDPLDHFLYIDEPVAVAVGGWMN